MVETFFPSILSHYREEEVQKSMHRSEICDVFRAQGAYGAFERVGRLFIEIRAAFRQEEIE